MEGNWLTCDYWLGIGGIAQVVAAVLGAGTMILGLIAICQARRTIKQGERMLTRADTYRRLDAEPHWAIKGTELRDHWRSDHPHLYVSVWLMNVGEGAALHRSEDLRDDSGKEMKIGQHDVEGRSGSTIVLKGEILKLGFRINDLARRQGTLAMQAKTRYGDAVTWIFAWEVSVQGEVPKLDISPKDITRSWTPAT